MTVRRRELLGAAALSLLGAPRHARAQPSAGLPKIGLLRPDVPTNPVDRAHLSAFLAGLSASGYANEKNVRVEARYAQGRLDRFLALARELASIPVSAIVTANPYATRAARAVTTTVPIVVALDYETDPVASGWIASLARPGGNLTGLFLDQPEMSGKLLQLLKECVPGLSKVAVLWDEAVAETQLKAIEGAGRTARLPMVSLGVRRAEDIAGAFDAGARERADGLVVLTSPFFTQSRVRVAICDLALKRRLPGITLFTTFPAFGLLMAYGPNQSDAFRRAASDYVVRILKGAQPADLPVQRPETFQLSINAATAKALGLTIPSSVLLQADEIIRKPRG